MQDIVFVDLTSFQSMQSAYFKLPRQNNSKQRASSQLKWVITFKQLVRRET